MKIKPVMDALERRGAEVVLVHTGQHYDTVMIDTLLANLERARQSDVLDRYGLSRGEYGLVTLHRPANVDDPEVLTALLKALGVIADRCPLLLPVHPRAAGRLADIGVPGGIRLVPPAGYLDFIALQDS